jgi:hypothetical protein
MSFVRFTNLPASANSAQTAKIDFFSLVRDLRNAAWGENLALKTPTYPIFLGYVTLITHIFFIWPYKEGHFLETRKSSPK